MSEASEYTAAWWAATAEGRFVVQECSRCGHQQHPPRAVCTRCEAFEWLGWREHDGTGILHTATQVHTTSYPAFQSRVPFWIGIAQLGDDIFLTANLLDPPGEVQIGQPVQVVFAEQDGRTVPFLRIEAGA